MNKYVLLLTMIYATFCKGGAIHTREELIMHKLKKIVVALICSTMIAGSLSGCGEEKRRIMILIKKLQLILTRKMSLIQIQQLIIS